MSCNQVSEIIIKTGPGLTMEKQTQYIEAVLFDMDESGIQANSFDVLIHGKEVKNRKPSPEIYLKAAEKLGVKPSHCLVIEDAVNGVKAAKAAGALCLALTTSFPEDQLGEADWIVKNLSEVSIHNLGLD